MILADDLGYGDVKCFDPDGKIPTPNLDRLAAGGMMFTDAHSPSALCSPTRYGLMTGRYAWRSRLKSGVLGGLSPRLIEPGRLTLARFLKDQGYHTACFGKWHLGMDWELKPGKRVQELGIESRDQVFNVEYDRPIRNGPNAVGFDTYFGISASLDMVPYTFIENDRVTASPTEDRDFPMVEGKASPRARKGPAAPGFDPADVLSRLAARGTGYIAERAKSGKPFFMYMPLTAPHTPVMLTPQWRGKSGINPYADFVMATDAAVGKVLAALDEHGAANDTLIFFTSDNGCAPLADFPELLKHGHNPNYKFRGSKADIYEGGHHLPFIVRWPGQIAPGSKSARLVCHTDIFATCAQATGKRLPADAAEDSFGFADVWTGKEAKAERTGIVMHSGNGSFAVREGKWKLCLCAGSGGWSSPRPGKEEKGLPGVQLYDLEHDIGEKVNLQDKHPEIVERLTKQLEKWVADGRSTPGEPQKNTTPVEIWKK